MTDSDREDPSLSPTSSTSGATTSSEEEENRARWRQQTQLVQGGMLRSSFGETTEALYLTQGFVYDSAEAAQRRFTGEEEGFIYARYGSPTVAMFEQRMALLEGAEAARATASGMAAVHTALLACLKAGDHVLAGRALFGSCHYVVAEVLPRFGIETTLVDGRDLTAWEQALRPNTRAIFIETPTNPMLELVDISALASLAHGVGAKLIVDNVFATPLWQSPLTLGADIVVYSATKHIDGQGRCLGGVVLSSKEWIEGQFHPLFKHIGPCISPFNAWILLKSLETLSLRVHQQTRSAAEIADFLADHPKIQQVIYPGRKDHPQAALVQKQMRAGSTLITFAVKGGKEGAFRLCNSLKLVRISNNLGDAKTLITHPATTTHHSMPEEVRAALGIHEGILRLSVGLENVHDLIEDFAAALDT